MRDVLRFMPEAEVPRRASGLIAREAAWPRALATLGLYAVGLGLAAAGVAAWRDGGWPLALGAGFAAFVLLAIGRVFQATWRAARGPGNWVVRAAPEGLYLKFRSYLHHRLPADDAIVVLIPKSAITWVRAHRVRMWRASERAETERIRHDRLEIKLAGANLAPLRKAIRDERQRFVVGRFGRTRFGHCPVRVIAEDEIVQIEWRLQTSRVTPPLDQALVRLGASYHRADAAETEYPRPSLGLVPAHEAQLRDHVERGERLAATNLARRIHGIGLTEAKALVESLARGEAPGTIPSRR